MRTIRLSPNAYPIEAFFRLTVALSNDCSRIKLKKYPKILDISICRINYLKTL